MCDFPDSFFSMKTIGAKIVFVHTLRHMHKIWISLSGSGSEDVIWSVLLNHNNISFHYRCAGVWCLSLFSNDLLWSEWSCESSREPPKTRLIYWGGKKENVAYYFLISLILFCTEMVVIDLHRFINRIPPSVRWEHRLRSRRSCTLSCCNNRLLGLTNDPAS